MRIANIAVAVLLFVGAAGCGCGDRFAQRELVLRETWAYSASSVDFRPFEIDTSQLPADTTVERVQRKNHCGNPVTELRIYNRPIKVVLMPATQPN